MRLRQIDALRGIAALLVASVFHIHNLIGGDVRTGPLDGIQPFTWIHRNGWTLVDLFFVISGYIFAYVYLTEGRLNAPVREFTIARIARLYPLHLLTLFVAATIGMSGSEGQFALSLLMLQENGTGMSFNTPAWSISVEVYCYAIFVIAARFGIIRQAAIGLIVLGFFLSFGGPTAHHIGRGLAGFFMGTLICRKTAPASVLATVIILCLISPHFFGINLGVVYGLTLWPAVVLLALQTPLSLNWLGDRSYSIYLWHAPLYFLLRPIAPPGFAGWALGVAAVLAVADVSYRFIESPARRLLRGLAREHLERPSIEHAADRARYNRNEPDAIDCRSGAGEPL